MFEGVYLRHVGLSPTDHTSLADIDQQGFFDAMLFVHAGENANLAL